MKYEIGIICHIVPADDEFDNIKCKVKEVIEDNEAVIIFLEPVIFIDPYGQKNVANKIGDEGVFDQSDLIPESPLTQLARALEDENEEG